MTLAMSLKSLEHCRQCDAQDPLRELRLLERHGLAQPQHLDADQAHHGQADGQQQHGDPSLVHEVEATGGLTVVPDLNGL